MVAGSIAGNLAARKGFVGFLMAVLFFASLSTVLFELALTRVFSIILWYDYAFMAISVAFFGLGIGSLMVHMHRDGRQGRLRGLLFPSTMSAESVTKKLVHHSIAYAITVPLFILAITQIPPDTSYIFMFYLVSSVPFFFAGSIMALVFFAMPRQISRLYFADLVGASSAALALDPLMQMFGAGSVLLLTSILVAGSATAGAFALRSMGRMKVPSLVLIAALAVLLVVTTPAIAIVQGAMQVTPGPNKGLYWQLKNPDFDHLSVKWNSFSRIDVTRQTDFTRTSDASQIRSSHELANIIIDATPIYRWSGDRKDLAWMRQYADYLPYDIVKAENSLVIGSGGGQDVMMAFAGGAKKVTAVELNPLVVSAVRTFGGPGNVYDNPDVELHIDDGRRFISSSAAKFDTITIKLVDSWAAQLAGGYALSENYLYTVEAFQQYFRHLDSGGMLVMIRWNFEIPRLMPIVAEAVQRETGESREDIARRIVVMEDRPGLYFGRTDDSQDYYPVLVMVKASPFTDREVSLIKQRATEGRADVTMLGSSQPAIRQAVLKHGQEQLQRLRSVDDGDKHQNAHGRLAVLLFKGAYTPTDADPAWNGACHLGRACSHACRLPKKEKKSCTVVVAATAAGRRLPRFVCRLYWPWFYDIRDNIHPEIPAFARHAHNGSDSHPVLHLAVKRRRRIPERQIVQGQAAQGSVCLGASACSHDIVLPLLPAGHNRHKHHDGPACQGSNHICASLACRAAHGLSVPIAHRHVCGQQ
ncbi:MAG: hypothetical protein ABI347_09485 [Nitrososphaera sp.]